MPLSDLVNSCEKIIKKHIPKEIETRGVVAAIKKIEDEVNQEIRSSKKDKIISFETVLVQFFLSAIGGDDYDIDYLKFLFYDVFFEHFANNPIFEDWIPYFTLCLEGIPDLVEIDEIKSFSTPKDSRYLYQRLRELHFQSKTKVPLLIVGETGTSKGLLSKAIHRMSRRKGKFIEINCAAIPETMIESELFGYKKGAFTGAIKDKDGLLKYADKGTVFLDELGKMPAHLQAKLLKVIEENKFYPLGEEKPTEIDVRYVAAVHPKDIEDKLIPDLKYRLGHPDVINLPTLNERLKEAPSILSNCLSQVMKKNNTGSFSLSKKAEELLKRHRYLGNFRELEIILLSAIRSASLANRNKILPEDLGILEQSPPISEIDLKDVKLKDIIAYAENKKNEIVKDKVNEVFISGKNIKQVLIEEGLPAKDYQSYLKRIRNCGVNIGKIKKK